mmetsp:Transcript_19526/g.28278  ORF Transcript_19526/g.28278 Transcript_19526/m.28278 type:complete len:178 (-) Transcript_19526:244-777(-)
MSTETWISGAHKRKETLLSKIGGEKTLIEAVDLFYKHLLSDLDLSRFFHGTNMEILKWHVLNFMSVAFGDVPKTFDLENLILDQHKFLFEDPYGLSVDDFDRFVGCFKMTLAELDIENDVVEEAVGVLQMLQPVFEKGQRDAELRKKTESRQLHFLQTAALASVVGMAVLSWAKKRN